MRFRFRKEDNSSNQQVSEDVVLDNGEKIEEVMEPGSGADDYDVLDGKDLATENDGITTTDVLGDWKPGDGVMSAKNVYKADKPKAQRRKLSFEEELQQEIEEQKKKKRRKRKNYNHRVWPRYGMFIPFPPPRPWPPQPTPPGPGPQPPPPGPGPQPGPEPGPAPAPAGGDMGGGGMAGGGGAPAGGGMGEGLRRTRR